MKFSFFLLAISLLFCIQAQAQTDSSKVKEEQTGVAEPVEEVFTFVQVLPEYKDGGESAFIQYITSYVRKHAAQPTDSTVAVSGSMYLLFYIEKDGSVSSASIVSGKGINPAYDQAAIEAVKKTQWIPASNNETFVRYKKVSRLKFY